MLLRKDYGKAKKYKPKQVARTIERAGLNTAYACYAICMFSKKSDFNQYHDEADEICDYDSMRSLVAQNHFNGYCDFSMHDITSVSASYGGNFGADGLSGGDGSIGNGD